jgi:tRNA threonylcarbamoyladenosine biosynthesis protein TsaE
MSTTREYTTHSAEETITLGRELALTLKHARMVILRGDLGAGKTTLVKGIAEGLQAASRDDITSPTFTLIHEFRGPEITLYHVDLYRIEAERELRTLGLDELFAEPGNLVLLEWGEKFPRFQKERDVEIAIERRGEQERRITVHWRPEVAISTWEKGLLAPSAPKTR